MHLQGQRWGSAIPAPVDIPGWDAVGHSASTTRMLDIAYESAVPPLVYERPTASPVTQHAPEAAGGGDEPHHEPQHNDFLADDSLRVYYAGDFTSRRAPGFEAACLSGIDAAEHIRKAFA